MGLCYGSKFTQGPMEKRQRKNDPLAQWQRRSQKGHSRVTCGVKYRPQGCILRVTLQLFSSGKNTQFVSLILQVLLDQGSSFSWRVSQVPSQKFPTKFHMGTSPSSQWKLEHSPCDTEGWPWGQQSRNHGVTSIRWVIDSNHPGLKRHTLRLKRERAWPPPRKHHFLLISPTLTFPTNFPPKPVRDYYSFLCNPLRLDFCVTMLVKDQPFENYSFFLECPSMISQVCCTSTFLISPPNKFLVFFLRT